ncbi:hypothetical protein CARUB_v10020851mg [Capsella rubella]|uniref:RING-type E3 ubiquitin transferase n=1 Tax=Capsella rubella TaxID=81985 RepID=R0GIC4_9BRAS|nr:RING-H2 finger protein ATL2 [Capsella rubella]EOA35637.1 hypothetical protein CARUB_v10020851mg [Capsella rubella]
MTTNDDNPILTYVIKTIIIIFFAVILVVLLHLFARWYLRRARTRHLRLRSRNRRRAIMAFFTADASTSRGLDPNVIKSLPIFIFSDKTHKDPIECAVCLSEFEHNESGRVLPNCKHTFHVDCIDMWFHSHLTCPICRSLVEPLAGIELTAAAAEEQVVIEIDSDPVLVIEPGSSSPNGSGSSPTPTDDSGRKPAEVEIPRRNFSEIEDELTRRDSPVSRMLSFSRMLSRDRRNASSPIAGATPRGVEETR